jgi:hypothetical protein
MSLRTKSATNGRPDYAKGGSIYLWEVNAEKSSRWAYDARRRAHRRYKRQRMYARIALVVSALIMVLVIWAIVDLLSRWL